MRGNYRVKEPTIPHNPPVCRSYRAVGKPGKLDGDLSKPFWQTGEWMDDFHDIKGDEYPRPWKYTRVKVLWDEEAIYVGAELKDDTIWATVMNRDELIFTDNDFEIFLAPQDSSHRYFEIEMNAANSVWDLMMERPQRDCVRRIIGWDVKGLESAVHIDGELNNPYADNKGWTLEVKIPWFSLRECAKDSCYPEKYAADVGDVWRMTFSRVEYNVDIVDGKYVKKTDPATGEPLLEENWLWAPTGVYDAHMPEQWGYLIFTEAGEDHPLPADDEAKMVLRRLYYREHAYCCQHNEFCTDAAALLGDEAEKWGVKAYATPSLFEGILEWNGNTYHINQDGYVWVGELY